MFRRPPSLVKLSALCSKCCCFLLYCLACYVISVLRPTSLPNLLCGMSRTVVNNIDSAVSEPKSLIFGISYLSPLICVQKKADPCTKYGIYIYFDLKKAVTGKYLPSSCRHCRLVTYSLSNVICYLVTDR